MTRTGFRFWFSEDDLMNTYYCWSRPAFDLLRANVLFVNNYYRSAAEVVYCGSYALFGFNPVPLSIFRFALGVANLFVLYTFVSRISRSREAGVIAVMLGGFHPASNDLFVDSGMLYDALAFFFYCSALSLYVKCRQEGRFPGVRQSIGILALSLVALNSKEIAVSFPVALFLYELTVGWQSSWQLPLLWKQFRLTLISVAITLAFIVGKTTGPEALSNDASYHPAVSLSNYLATYSRYASEFLIYVTADAIRPWLFWALVGCILLAALLRHRVLLWASLFNVFAILPIAVIPPRGGFAFVVPLAGWLTYFAVLITWLRAKVTFRSLSLQAPSQLAVAAAIWLTILRPYSFFTREFQRPIVHREQDANRELWNSLRAILPASVAHKKIFVRHDPMTLAYASRFLIQLGYNVKDVVVETDRTLPHTPPPPDSL